MGIEYLYGYLALCCGAAVYIAREYYRDATAPGKDSVWAQIVTYVVCVPLFSLVIIPWSVFLIVAKVFFGPLPPQAEK